MAPEVEIQNCPPIRFPGSRPKSSRPAVLTYSTYLPQLVRERLPMVYGLWSLNPDQLVVHLVVSRADQLGPWLQSLVCRQASSECLDSLP